MSSESQEKSTSKKLAPALIIIFVIVGVAVGLGAYALSRSNMNSSGTPNPSGPSSPHFTFSIVGASSVDYNNAKVVILSSNTTTIVKYDIWCDSDKWTSQVNWSFSHGTSYTENIYSGATTSNNYADFSSQSIAQYTYHLTLYTSSGLSSTADFHVS